LGRYGIATSPDGIDSITINDNRPENVGVLPMLKVRHARGFNTMKETK